MEHIHYMTFIDILLNHTLYNIPNEYLDQSQVTVIVPLNATKCWGRMDYPNISSNGENNSEKLTFGRIN